MTYRVTVNLIVMGLLTLALASRQATSAPTRGVTLGRGASLQEAARVIQVQRGGVVVAEAPVTQRLLREPMEGVEIPQALDQISREFDVYWESRPRSLALHRRLYDPEEQLDLDEEEIRRVSADVARLVRPFAPGPPGMEETVRQNDFFRSLTKAQRNAMQRPGGLRLTDLQVEQQRAWLLINRSFGFSQMGQTTARAARLLAEWKRWEFVFNPSDSGGYWWVQDPRDPKGGWPLVPLVPPGKPELPAARGAGSPINSPAPTAPGWLQQRIQLPAGEYSLDALVGQLGAATNGKITIPAYAAKRRVLVAAKGARASEILQALRDLYGWDLFPRSGEPSARLDRPTSSAARDVADLHAKVRRALPPAVHLWFFHHREVSWHRSATENVGVGPLLERLAELYKRDKKPVPLNDLSPILQRRAVNGIFSLAFEQSTSNVTASPMARAVLTNPERGWFTIERGEGPDALPVITFHVAFGDSGRVDSWGWADGSSSLGQGEH